MSIPRAYLLSFQSIVHKQEFLPNKLKQVESGMLSVGKCVKHWRMENLASGLLRMFNKWTEHLWRQYCAYTLSSTHLFWLALFSVAYLQFRHWDCLSGLESFQLSVACVTWRFEVGRPKQKFSKVFLKKKERKKKHIFISDHAMFNKTEALGAICSLPWSNYIYISSAWQ